MKPFRLKISAHIEGTVTTEDEYREALEAVISHLDEVEKTVQRMYASYREEDLPQQRCYVCCRSKPPRVTATTKADTRYFCSLECYDEYVSWIASGRWK